MGNYEDEKHSKGSVHNTGVGDHRALTSDNSVNPGRVPNQRELGHALVKWARLFLSPSLSIPNTRDTENT